MFAAEPHPFLVPFNGTFRTADALTAPDESTLNLENWKEILDKEKEAMGRWQHKLYADQRFAVLLIFQALDAGGKDSTIRHILSGINPTGIRVTSFKRPSAAETAHDFLWRTTLPLPERGHIGVFNRSYYEEVLVVRVHPELLAAQRIDGSSPEFWPQRYRSIAEHEAHLARSGTVVLKFWLNVSKDEQRRRILDRIDQPDKRWKFSPRDIDERAHWESYTEAFEDCLNATSRPWAPWYAIPADDKPFMRYQVAKIVNNAFKSLDIRFPELAPEIVAELPQARQRLAD